MSDLKNFYDIAGRSMGAQLVRLNTIASNIANAQTVAGSAAEAYRPLRPVFEVAFAEGMAREGVATVDVREIVALDREPQQVYQPDHPLADADGYIYRAPVDVDEEMVEMLEASRQYQNTLEVVTTLRALMMRTVDMGKS